MHSITAFSASLKPTSFKMTALISTALILIAALSLSNILPISNTDSTRLITSSIAAFIIGYTLVFLKAHSVSKVVFGALTIITLLYITGTLQPMSQTVAIGVLSTGFLGLLFSISLRKKKSDIPKFVKEMIANAENGRPIKDIHLTNPFEYAMLHHELAQHTEAQCEPHQKKNWETILNRLDKNVRIHYDSGTILLLDCSVEKKRLQGEHIALIVEELPLESLTGTNLTQLNIALKEAFDCDPNYAQSKLLEGKGKTKLYVGKDKNTNEILGGLFIDEKEDGSLFIHSLCRRAKATKIKLTDTIAEFLKTVPYNNKKPTVRCTVALENHVAHNLYTKLGFIIEHTGEHYTMVLKPS